MSHIALLNPENISQDEARKYSIRKTARAIILDNENKIALLHVTKENFFKLPGGGVEEGEDVETALRRECREEVGVEIEITGEVGSIHEWRKFEQLRQISYCYTALVKGEKGTPNFTDEEKENGFEIFWLTAEEALEKLSQNQTSGIEGREYIVPRELLFVKRYLE